MGNVCKTTSLTVNTEISDEYVDHHAIMSTNNRAIFNEIYREEQFEPTIKLHHQPLIT